MRAPADARRRPAAQARRRRQALAVCAVLSSLAGAVWGASSGSGATAPGPLLAEPVLSAPSARLIDASPDEAPGEVWGTIGPSGADPASIVRYTDSGGWQEMAPLDAAGQPLDHLVFPSSPSAGSATALGGVAIAAGRLGSARQPLLLRDPGGEFQEAPDPASVLAPHESLYRDDGERTRVLLAAVDETPARTGAFVVPASDLQEGFPDAVLHFDGVSWSREPICVGAGSSSCVPPKVGLRVLAIAASGPGDAWLLAKGSLVSEGVVLFSREGGVWRQQNLGGPLGDLFEQALPSVPQPPGPKLTVRIASREVGQPLTVTPHRIWVDADVSVAGVSSSATLTLDPGSGTGGATVEASWCDLPAAVAVLCTYPLDSDLPSGPSRSFAWDDGGPYGRRVITGVGEGALLSFEGTAFARIGTAGGRAGTTQGAAFTAADDGWLGASTLVRVSRTPSTPRLRPWPVPFRRPLLAIAPEPGRPVGAIDSGALAVGDDGQVARYVPGQGWEAEYLLSPSGARAHPRLRGVAWPEPGRAHAVGDGREMWLWRAATGLWEPDPGRPANLIRGNFTAIAFDPANPARGFAVGKQGLLLRYGRKWTQDQLPAGVDPEVNFTSLTFAGDEAIATFKLPLAQVGAYSGGVLVEDGTGWRLDEGAALALGEGVPARVAGLPDGGAVISTSSGLISRAGPDASWERTDSGKGGWAVALAAFREDGAVRALVSVPANSSGFGKSDWDIDSDQALARPLPGEPQLLTHPYELPAGGYLMRQTSGGWRDEQRQAFPVASHSGDVDWPLRPDAALALLLAPDGSSGWSVGGETGQISQHNRDAIQTAGVMRYGDGAVTSSDLSSAPVTIPPESATFGIGGNAQCAGPCADLAGVGIGPDRWLPAAVAAAAAIPGVRAFIHTGPGVADEASRELSSLAFLHESRRYAARLASEVGSLPTFAAPAESDLDNAGDLDAFSAAFSGASAPFGTAPPSAGIQPLEGSGHGYAFDSLGSGVAVRVVVLDYSAPRLGAVQSCWLARQLAGAKALGRPAIVVGNRSLGPAGAAANIAVDAAEVVPILTGAAAPTGCGPPAPASAYFFDQPEQNRAFALTAGGRSIPAFGSGTLGYLNTNTVPDEELDATGFLLASVGSPDSQNVAPVSVRLIPSIGDLALDATDGTLPRRSRPALFEALARRPRAGLRSMGCCDFDPDPYVEIPARCTGSACASGIFPEYSFSSSNPDIADFVAADPASRNPRSVLLGPNDKPLLDSRSGLLCPFNAGTTIVTVTAGGLTYSQKVTVQSGSVRRPCGTVPLRNPPSRTLATVPPPVASPQPQPGFDGGPTTLPPPAPPSVPGTTPVASHPVPAPPASAPPFFPPPLNLTPLVAIVPPPPPPAAQTTPPSGTSPVTQPVTSPSPEDEDEVAIEHVHHMSAYEESVRGFRANVAIVPTIAILAAFGFATALRGPRRGHRKLAYQASSTTPRRRP